MDPANSGLWKCKKRGGHFGPPLENDLGTNLEAILISLRKFPNKCEQGEIHRNHNRTYGHAQKTYQ